MKKQLAKALKRNEELEKNYNSLKMHELPQAIEQGRLELLKIREASEAKEE